jgi:hypothetical protein
MITFHLDDPLTRAMYAAHVEDLVPLAELAGVMNDTSNAGPDGRGPHWFSTTAYKRRSPIRCVHPSTISQWLPIASLQR